MFANLDKKKLMYIGAGVVVFIVLAYTIWYYTKGKNESFMEQNRGKHIFRMFFAPWCGHCNAAHPAFDNLVKGGSKMINNQQVDFAFVNSDNDRDMMSKFQIQAFPTYILTKSSGENIPYDGRGRDEQSILNWLQQTL
jgi:thiol-disulfide isomerase/thioredoxin